MKVLEPEFCRTAKDIADHLANDSLNPLRVGPIASSKVTRKVLPDSLRSKLAKGLGDLETTLSGDLANMARRGRFEVTRLIKSGR